MGAETPIALGALILACAGVVLALLALRRRPVNPDQPDVDELALELDRLRKLVRRTHMSRVRTGESSPEDSSPDATPPPQLRPSPQLAAVFPSKDDLRRRAGL